MKEMRKEVSINVMVKSDEEVKEFLKDIETLKEKYTVFVNIQIMPSVELSFD